jgi:hypothetical protein
MRTTDHLQYALKHRQLGSGSPAAAGSIAQSASTIGSDVKLFAMTFAAGFLFTAIFIA